jgi:YcxB-like protein
VQNDPDVIFGRVQLTEDDLRRGLAELSPLYRRRWWSLGVLVAVFGLMAMSGSSATLGRLAADPSALAGMLVPVVLCVLIVLGPRLGARRMMKTLGLGDGEVDYRFDPEGLTIRAPGSSSTTAYRRVHSHRVTSDAFLIYSTPLIANIVPKRAFAPADLPRIEAWLAANVQPQRKIERRSWKILFLVWIGLIFFFLIVWQLFQQRPH